MFDACVICRGVDGDRELFRTEVWSDRHWRLTTSINGQAVAGCSYLEPYRHVTEIGSLDGPVASAFDGVLSQCTAVLKEITRAERVRVLFDSDLGHLRVRLLPDARIAASNGHPAEADRVRQRPPLPDTVLQITAAQLRGAFLHSPPAPLLT